MLLAIVLLWNRAVGWEDLALLVALYVPIGLGVTVGFHRLLTHRSFQTYKPVEYGLAMLGSMSVQGPVIHWVADHRKHHAHTDVDGDPHSPHTGEGKGLRGLLARAHRLAHDRAGPRRAAQVRAATSSRIRACAFISRHFELWVLLGLAIPFAAGWLIHGDLTGALIALVWAGLVRVFLLHHVTWSINSVCHFYGRRRFVTDDHSTNVFWLALPSLGEAWHHNHHAFPRSHRHGLRGWELDPTAWVIWAMRRLGLAWNVVEITPERQAQLQAQPVG